MANAEVPAAEGSVYVFDSAEDAARAVARRFVALAREALAARGHFSVALAGGSTPQRVYELLATDEHRESVAWEQVQIFFGDERCVSSDHAASNYRMAYESLLSRVPLPPQNIHRMKGEGDPALNAELYERELRAFFKDAEWPQFDLVMLGMGDDGHTASLFPQSAALKDRTAWVVANWVEKLKSFRLTLTVPAINQAAHVIFTVTGAGKAERLAQVLRRAPGALEPLPAQLIRPRRGTLEWFVDTQAAAKF
jgi:6-phosphogluconolactonase